VTIYQTTASHPRRDTVYGEALGMDNKRNPMIFMVVSLKVTVFKDVMLYRVVDSSHVSQESAASTFQLLP
jgi:hypothetical protein